MEFMKDEMLYRGGNDLNMKKRLFSVVLSIVLILGIAIPVQAANLDGNGNHYIKGSNSVTIGQMINYYQSRATYPSYYAGTDAPTIYDFCKIYSEECAAEGVDVLVAFAQCIHETGFLRYTGDVRINQHNFAGIGATGGGNPGKSYATVRLGIRAHVQRLKAYSTPGMTASQFVYPLVDAGDYLYTSPIVGSAPIVEYLSAANNPTGMGWAPSSLYPVHVISYMNGIEAASTFTTWYQGVNYAGVYDPYYYSDANGDVRAAFGSNGDALIAHFVNYGMSEGRTASASFSWKSYKLQYADLRAAYGNDTKSYYMHYVKYGRSEGRRGTGCNTLHGAVTVLDGVNYSAVYDYNYYISAYRDVANAFGEDDVAVLRHFVNYGMAEGRRGSASFDWKSYKLQYADLRGAYGNDIRSYYMHYVRYGKNEGRQATGCTTLCGATTVLDGVNYAPVYNYYYYINNNRDVASAFAGDDVATLRHFVKYGMSEGRVASSSFNIRRYKDINGDIRIAYGDDTRSYYMHYIMYGRYENRNAV